MALCIAAGAVAAVLLSDTFTLGWTHSIERLRWEEDWQVTGTMLEIREARIRGTGAGMEAPPGALLKNGVWHYRPALPPQRALNLAHSGYVPEFELCVEGKCRPLSDWLPGLGEHAGVTITSCADGGSPPDRH